MELKNGNLIARIKETTHNGFVVSIVQVCNTGLGTVEDFFDLKTGFKTLAGAERYAKKIIN